MFECLSKLWSLAGMLQQRLKNGLILTNRRFKNHKNGNNCSDVFLNRLRTRSPPGFFFCNIDVIKASGHAVMKCPQNRNPEAWKSGFHLQTDSILSTSQSSWVKLQKSIRSSTKSQSDQKPKCFAHSWNPEAFLNNHFFLYHNLISKKYKWEPEQTEFNVRSVIFAAEERKKWLIC